MQMFQCTKNNQEEFRKLLAIPLIRFVFYLFIFEDIFGYIVDIVIEKHQLPNGF